MSMQENMKILTYRDNADGTQMILKTEKNLGWMLQEKQIRSVEVLFPDGRQISPEQRRKAYATIGDIADYTGYSPEETKQLMKMEYITRRNGNEISLATCSMDEAREFISTMIEFCLDHDIPLSESALERTEDIGRYLWYCLRTRHCCICGKPHSDIHHEDAIGMGQDRRTYDDRNNRKICLCRTHHILAHQKGIRDFREMYRVYGIKYDM